MPKVFISYRREDTPETARRLYDKLAKLLGQENVFIDVDTIEYGSDFRASIERYIFLSDVVLILIGLHWNGAEGERRLLQPNDFVRYETEMATRHKKSILPIFVGEDTGFPPENEMPPTLVEFRFLHGIHCSPELTDEDFNGVIQYILSTPAVHVGPDDPDRIKPTPLYRKSAEPGLTRSGESVLPADPIKFRYDYGQYRIVIPALAYRANELHRYEEERKPLDILDDSRSELWIAVAGSIVLVLCIGGGELLNLFGASPQSTGYGAGVIAIISVVVAVIFAIGAAIYYWIMGLFIEHRNRARSIEKYYRQLLTAARLSSREDETNLVKAKYDPEHPLTVFGWYQEYCMLQTGADEKR